MSEENAADYNPFLGREGYPWARTLGYEWIRIGDPSIHREPGVWVESSVGMLALSRIEKWSTGINGGVHNVLVKPEELKTL